jgi:putative holliday junction resolvase
VVLVGVDYGTVRIGLAKSDEARSIAFPFTTVARGTSDEAGVVAALAALDGVEVEAFVLGLPLTLDGDEGQSARKVRRFGAILAEKSGLPVHYVDERLSSAAASRHLREMGMDEKAQRGLLDERAAALILETYLGSIRKVTWEGDPNELSMPDEGHPRGRGRRGRSRR